MRELIMETLIGEASTMMSRTFPETMAILPKSWRKGFKALELSRLIKPAGGIYVWCDMPAL